MNKTKEEKEINREVENTTTVYLECVSKRWKGKYQKLTVIYKNDSHLVISARDNMAIEDAFYSYVNGIPLGEWTIEALTEFFHKFHNNQ